VAKEDLKTAKGIHKTTWNMRYEGLGPNLRGGPMVAPGTYNVQAFKFADGKSESLGNPVAFEIESIVTPTLEMPDRAQTIAFIKQMGLFANRTYAASTTLSERLEQITKLTNTIRNHPNGTPELLAEANTLKLRMEEFGRKLRGNQLKSKRWVLTEPGINSRLQRAMSGSLRGTHGPTRTAREQYKIGSDQFKTIEADLLKLIGDEMEAFEKAVDDARIPWTKGRDLRSLPGRLIN
jgi:hypothetical protein